MNNTVTPFERPKEFAGRQLLSDDELAVLKQRAARLFDGSGDTAPGDELFLALMANIYEFACHEENRALKGILAGARATEKSTDVK